MRLEWLAFFDRALTAEKKIKTKKTPGGFIVRERQRELRAKREGAGILIFVFVFSVFNFLLGRRGRERKLNLFLSLLLKPFFFFFWCWIRSFFHFWSEESIRVSFSETMNVMRRLKSIASGRTSISSDPVSFWLFIFCLLLMFEVSKVCFIFVLFLCIWLLYYVLFRFWMDLYVRQLKNAVM